MTTNDEETCRALGDVLTITANADAGVRDGRMASQEGDGWYRLATRVLDRVPSRGEGAISDALDDLKATAPPIKLGASHEAGIGAPGWDDALGRFGQACMGAGYDLALEGFTGG